MEEKTTGEAPAVLETAKINLFAEKTLKKAASAVLALGIIVAALGLIIGCGQILLGNGGLFSIAIILGGV